VGTEGADCVAFDVDIISDSGDQPYGISDGVITQTNRNSAQDILGISGVTGNYRMSVVNDTAGTDLGSPIGTVVFTAPLETGTVALSLLENSFFDTGWMMYGVDREAAIVEGMDVTITPEPITLALLGLGGLFIRRK